MEGVHSVENDGCGVGPYQIATTLPTVRRMIWELKGKHVTLSVLMVDHTILCFCTTVIVYVQTEKRATVVRKVSIFGVYLKNSTFKLK